MKSASEEIWSAIEALGRAEQKIDLPEGEEEYVEALRALRQFEKDVDSVGRALQRLHTDAQMIETWGTPD